MYEYDDDYDDDQKYEDKSSTDTNTYEIRAQPKHRRTTEAQREQSRGSSSCSTQLLGSESSASSRPTSAGKTGAGHDCVF